MLFILCVGMLRKLKISNSLEQEFSNGSSSSILVWSFVNLGAIIFFQMGGGPMKKLGGHIIFSWEIGGSQKNQEIIGVATNFNENCVQWNSPPNALFSALRAVGVTCFFNIVAPDGGGS